MASAITLTKIKADLRISHTALDDDLRDTIDACLADLTVVGIAAPDEYDPLILSAIKLYCRAAYTDDTSAAAEYLNRYSAQKATLMVAAGYGGEADG